MVEGEGKERGQVVRWLRGKGGEGAAGFMEYSKKIERTGEESGFMPEKKLRIQRHF